MRKVRIGFLVSGNGGTLKFICLAARQLDLPFEIAVVLADRACGALDYAYRAGLPCQQIRYNRNNTEQLRAALRAASPDVIVTNIHKIIDIHTLRLFPNLFINLHYSLLPAFKGLIGMQTVEQAHLLNVTIVGATCHELDEQVDSGRCLSQFAAGVNWTTDSLNEVKELVFRGASMILLQVLLQRASNLTIGRSSISNMMGRCSIFTPSLIFDVNQLDDAFWQSIKAS